MTVYLYSACTVDTQYMPHCCQELVRNGVPQHFRGIVWQLLCGAHESTAKAKYSEYLKQNSACEKVIRRDITRTYPEHELFKEKNGLGQESLFNVMKVMTVFGLCRTCVVIGNEYFPVSVSHPHSPTAAETFRGGNSSMWIFLKTKL